MPVVAKLMKEVKGYPSCKTLLERLYKEFGEENIQLVGGFDRNCDAFGWKFIDQANILYSISTREGQLENNLYDIMISTREGAYGELLVDDSMQIEDVLKMIHAIHRRKTG